MRKIFLLLIVFILTSCGSDEPNFKDSIPKEYHWDKKYTFITESGFYVSLQESTLDYLSYEEIENKVEEAWFEIQECTGIYTELNRPLILEYTYNLPYGYNGFIYWGGEYIYSRIHANDFYELFDMHITRHELLHYLLYINGESQLNNSQHNSYLWESCR